MESRYPALSVDCAIVQEGHHTVVVHKEGHRIVVHTVHIQVLQEEDPPQVVVDHIAAVAARRQYQEAVRRKQEVVHRMQEVAADAVAAVASVVFAVGSAAAKAVVLRPASEAFAAAVLVAEA